jgi:hypothetical protein
MRYCFTGTFNYGQSEHCVAEVLRRGGLVGAITQSTNDLVIGAYVARIREALVIRQQDSQSLRMAQSRHPDLDRIRGALGGASTLTSFRRVVGGAWRL